MGAKFGLFGDTGKLLTNEQDGIADRQSWRRMTFSRIKQITLPYISGLQYIPNPSNRHTSNMAYLI